MDLGLDGKTALVTGASRGIGLATAQTLAAEGVTVVGICRTPPSDQVYKNVRFIECDLSSLDAVHDLIRQLIQDSFYPDIIINNVGGNLGHTDPLSTSQAWLDVGNLNLVTSMLFNESFIPHMVRKKWGRICHVSSISALENQGPPAYCAVKAALNAYVRSLGRYVAKDNVILTSIMPGAIFTEGGYWDDALRNRPDHVSRYLSDRMAIQRFGTLDEVSQVITFMVSEHTSFAPGTSFLLDGGQGRAFYTD